MLTALNLTFTVLFCIEAALKLIAYGLVSIQANKRLIDLQFRVDFKKSTYDACLRSVNRCENDLFELFL